MTQLNKNFINDLLIAILLWVVAIPLLVIENSAPNDTLYSIMAGIAGGLCSVLGMVTIIYGGVRRMIHTSKEG
jgi:hypothetical protein